MKLVRFVAEHEVKPGCVDQHGNIRDLSAYLNDLSLENLHPEKLQTLTAINPEALPLIENAKLAPCVSNVGKFICIGLNYADHAREIGSNPPKEPVVFLKATSSICGPHDDILIPKNSKHTDWEVELGVVIGKKAKYVKEEEAASYIAGYCIVQDVSERHFQFQRGGQWDKGKGCDTFGPIGPWLVTTDEITDPQNLTLWLEVNGKRYQEGHTRNMLFSVKFLISYLSEFFTLHPGDIITTGTPSGIGMSQKPQAIFLQHGHKVRLGIEGLGEQEHAMVAETDLDSSNS